jgi:hypothetical protein
VFLRLTESGIRRSAMPVFRQRAMSAACRLVAPAFHRSAVPALFPSVVFGSFRIGDVVPVAGRLGLRRPGLAGRFGLPGGCVVLVGEFVRVTGVAVGWRLTGSNRAGHDVAGRMISGAAALAGLVRTATGTDEPGVDRMLPVAAELSGLLPGRGLRRGSTVAVAAGQSVSAGGGTSLMLALLAAASRNGSWCAVVGVPALGALAAAESGIVLERLALVPNPGPDWPTVVAALIDGVDVVVAAVPGPVSAPIVSRLAARARQRGSLLVPFGDWSGADVTLRIGKGRWEGLGSGRGRLRRREVTVVAQGRGAAARPREITMWMPGVSVSSVTIPPAPSRPEDPPSPGSAGRSVAGSTDSPQAEESAPPVEVRSGLRSSDSLWSERALAPAQAQAQAQAPTPTPVPAWPDLGVPAASESGGRPAAVSGSGGRPAAVSGSGGRPAAVSGSGGRSAAVSGRALTVCPPSSGRR